MKATRKTTRRGDHHALLASKRHSNAGGAHQDRRGHQRRKARARLKRGEFE